MIQKLHKGEKLPLRDTNIRGIVTDIDGTITGYDRRIQVSAIEALRKVRDAGYSVILATGNVLPIAYAFQRLIGLDGPIVAENGGILCHNEKVEYLNNLQDAQKAYDFLRRQTKVKRLFTDRWRLTEIALEPSVDVDLVKRLLKDFDVNVEDSVFAIHIEGKTYNKLTALKRACSLIGLDVKQLAAFGDGVNDIDMLTGCGLGIAVGNASEEVRKAAAYTTSGEFGEGLVEGLRWIGLLE